MNLKHHSGINNLSLFINGNKSNNKNKEEAFFTILIDFFFQLNIADTKKFTVNDSYFFH
jgi:hypothetical protein